MRLSPVIGCLALTVVCSTPLTVRAEDDSFEMLRTNARRELEIAKLELRLYLQVEYPRELRHLDSEIKLTDAEIKAREERLREYRPFDKFQLGQPFLVTLQHERLGLLDAQLRLKDLKAERFALVRFHSDHARLLELRAMDARARLAELEGGTKIALEPTN